MKNKYAQLADRFKQCCGMCTVGDPKKVDGKSIYPGLTLSSYIKEEGENKIDNFVVEQIRAAYVFRWILGMKNNSDRNLRVLFSEDQEKISVTSWNEKEPTLDLEKSRLPSTVIRRWFDGDFDEAIKISREMFTNSTINEFRKIIEEEDLSYIGWLNIIRRNMCITGK